MILTIGSLFSGIGGLELGLERAGLGPVLWQVEIDPFARAVLAKHWPTATRYEDVRVVGAELPPVDIICGGFPCQDISSAGKRVGIDGERSGLWSEYARIIRLVRPRFVVVENVAALLHRGMGRVLGDLAALGYDAEWRVLRASDVGAPHRRERVFILAHANVDRREGERRSGVLDRERTPRRRDVDGCGGAPLANPDAAERGAGPAGRIEPNGHRGGREEAPGRPGLHGTHVADADDGAGGSQPRQQLDACIQELGCRGRGGDVVADALGEAGRSEAREPVSGDSSTPIRCWPEEPRRCGSEVADPDGLGRHEGPGRDDEARWLAEPGDGCGAWPPGPDDMHAWRSVPALAQPSICRLADGLPDGLVRGRRPSLKALGNAVVPAVGWVVGLRLSEIAADAA